MFKVSWLLSLFCSDIVCRCLFCLCFLFCSWCCCRYCCPPVGCVLGHPGRWRRSRGGGAPQEPLQGAQVLLRPWGASVFRIGFALYMIYIFWLDARRLRGFAMFAFVFSVAFIPPLPARVWACCPKPEIVRVVILESCFLLVFWGGTRYAMIVDVRMS